MMGPSSRACAHGELIPLRSRPSEDGSTATGGATWSELRREARGVLLGIVIGAAVVSAGSRSDDFQRAVALSSTPTAAVATADAATVSTQDYGTIVKCSGVDKRANAAACDPDVIFSTDAKNVAYNGEDKQRVYSTFDKMMQGPTRWVTLDDVVRVSVTNSLGTAGLTVHHHGIHMAGTPFFDGSNMISQANIPTSGTMDYQFRAFPAGTHWYHGHSGGDYADGLRGMFIVRDPDDPYQQHYHQEDALLVYDVNSQMSATEVR